MMKRNLLVLVVVGLACDKPGSTTTRAPSPASPPSQPQVAKLRLSLPPGVSATVDGEPATGFVDVEPGEHHVAFSTSCDTRASRTINVAVGTELTIETTEVTASVLVHALDQGDLPIEAVVEAGGHRGPSEEVLTIEACPTRIRVRAPGLAELWSEIQPKPGETIELWAPLSPGTTMVRIPAGSFVMGPSLYGLFSWGHIPRFERTMPSFDIGRTEVTAAQYLECVEAGECPARISKYGSSTRGCHLIPAASSLTAPRPELPANCISRRSAAAYCRFIGQRLPTDVEWEYAARSASDSTWPWGEDPPTCEHGITRDCADGPQPPCSASRGNTRQGACDFSGNVSEYTRPTTFEGRFRGAAAMGEHADALPTPPFAASTNRPAGPETGFRCARSSPSLEQVETQTVTIRVSPVAGVMPPSRRSSSDELAVRHPDAHHREVEQAQRQIANAGVGDGVGG
jgi:formylglycine-generating enzyme required for sulfatase activity